MMRIQFEFSSRLYLLIERAVIAIESIDQTLKAAPEDFTTEDEIVSQAAEQVAEAKERIPHGT